jgi:hypothetical protein
MTTQIIKKKNMRNSMYSQKLRWNKHKTKSRVPQTALDRAFGGRVLFMPPLGEVTPSRVPQTPFPNRNSNSLHSTETVPAEVVAIRVAAIKVPSTRLYYKST